MKWNSKGMKCLDLSIGVVGSPFLTAFAFMVVVTMFSIVIIGIPNIFKKMLVDVVSDIKEAKASKGVEDVNDD